MEMMMIHVLFSHCGKPSQGREKRVLLKLLSQSTGQASVRAPQATKHAVSNREQAV